MTEQEAIEEIRDRMACDFNIKGCDTCNILSCSNKDAVILAIKALEKQIVKPPKFETLKGGFVQKRCVVCGNKILPFYASYCTSCGQRLE